MKKYIEKILGIYGESREKIINDISKKEIPLSAIFGVASLLIHPYLSYISMFFSIRGIAHVEKLRELEWKNYEELLRKVK